MKKMILLLFILTLLIFNGCTKCEPQIIIETKYIKTKQREFISLETEENCTFNKGINFGDLNNTSFWVNKEKFAECSNVSMRRKDKNLIYSKQKKKDL